MQMNDDNVCRYLFFSSCVHISVWSRECFGSDRWTRIIIRFYLFINVMVKADKYRSAMDNI